MKQNKTITSAGALILVGGLLTACTDSDEQAASSQVEAAESTQENAEQAQGYDVKEIAEYLKHAELPDAKIIDPNNVMYGGNDDIVIYEGGYYFDKESGKLKTFHNQHAMDNLKDHPEFFKGYVMHEFDFIVNATQLEAMQEVFQNPPIGNLETIKEYTDFEPLKAWADDRIAEYEAGEDEKAKEAIREVALLIDRDGSVARAIEQEELNDEIEEREKDVQALIEIDPEIVEFIKNYELPEEGQLPKGDPEYDGVDSDKLVAYDNGYLFDRSTGAVVARKWNEDDTPPLPTAEQATGVILGHLIDAMTGQSAQRQAEEDNEFVMHRLTESEKINEFAPLDEWLMERIEGYSKAATIENERERILAYADQNAEMKKMIQLIKE